MSNSENAPLPNGDRAIVELTKLRDYCLNPSHLRGQHKARVFRAGLGLVQRDAAWMQARLLDAAARYPAQKGRRDSFGQRYVVDFEVSTDTGTANVRSSWIILTGENVPRLTSCFIL